MKLVWIGFLVLASCKVSTINKSFIPVNSSEGHRIEITFVSSDYNYYAVMDAIRQMGFVSELQYYPVASLSQPVNKVSFHCSNLSDPSLVQFKNRIGACSGVLSIHDATGE